jgi:hypothetical protein
MTEDVIVVVLPIATGLEEAVTEEITRGALTVRTVEAETCEPLVSMTSTVTV